MSWDCCFFNATSGNFTEYNADLGFLIIHFIAYLIPSYEAYTFAASYYHRTTDVLVSYDVASTPSKPNWHPDVPGNDKATEKYKNEKTNAILDMPKHLYEKVVALHLGRLGAKISKLTKNWSHYLSIPILTSLLAYMYGTDQRGYLLFGKTTSKKLWD
ncbi:S-adenosyl-L-homocysteine hydrolase, partial [Tanacetum coccineum]